MKERFILKIRALQFVTLGIIFLELLFFGKNNLNIAQLRFNLLFSGLGLGFAVFQVFNLYLKKDLNTESSFYKKMNEFSETQLKKYYILNLFMLIPLAVFLIGALPYLKNHIISLLTLLYIFSEKIREKNEYIRIGKIKYSLNTAMLIIFVLAVLILKKFNA